MKAAPGILPRTSDYIAYHREYVSAYVNTHFQNLNWSMPLHQGIILQEVGLGRELCSEFFSYLPSHGKGLLLGISSDAGVKFQLSRLHAFSVLA